MITRGIGQEAEEEHYDNASRSRAHRLGRGAWINPACAKLLPVAAVKKATGKSNIKLIAKDYKIGAGGDCNYAIDGKIMVLLVLPRSAPGRAVGAVRR